MTILFDKRSCLKRANDMLSTNDDSLLRYACLELRFCLEDIAYRKLSTYAKRLPDEVLKTWQPPQAFRALLEFEPYADQTTTIRICEETSRGYHQCASRGRVFAPTKYMEHFTG